MKPDFWIDSWNVGGSKTSFHRPDIHPYVQTYFPPSLLKGKRVLVPLCGKTNDLIWYRQHAEHVVGVELVQLAIEQFFFEHELAYKLRGNRYEATGITLLNKNIFDLQPSDIGVVNFIYDRASLIALPLDMRLHYLQKIDEMIPCRSKTLLITLEYAPLKTEPPFSVSPIDVELYYSHGYTIEHVEAKEIPHHPLVKKWNLDFLKEHAFILTKTHSLQLNPNNNQKSIFSLAHA